MIITDLFVLALFSNISSLAFTVNVGAVLSIVKTYVVDNLFSLLVTINEYSPSSDKIVPEINSSSFKIQEYFSSSKYGIILKLI